MRALVKKERKPGLWMEEAPVPEIGPQDVLIKVRRSAICGTDVHIWNWDQWAQATIPVPMTIGHEFMGEVAAVGDEVEIHGLRLRVDNVDRFRISRLSLFLPQDQTPQNGGESPA